MTSALPKDSTLHMSIRQRTLGRALDIDTTPAPMTPGEADLAADIFWHAYAHDMAEKEPPSDSRLINKALLEYMREDAPAWERSTLTTRGNILAALTVTSTMYSYLVSDQALRDALKQQDEAEQLMQQMPDVADQLQEALDELEEEEKKEQERQEQEQSGEDSAEEGDNDCDCDGDCQCDNENDGSPDGGGAEGDEGEEEGEGGAGGDAESDADGDGGSGGQGQGDQGDADASGAGAGGESGEPNSAEPNEPTESPQLQQARQRAQDIEQQLKDMADEVQEKLGRAKEQVDAQRDDDVQRIMLNHAASEGLKDAKEQVAAARGWGLGMSDTIQTDPGAVMQYKDMLTDKVKQIAQLAGRLRGIANTARKTKPEAGFVPTTVAFTQNIGDMLPEELMMLGKNAPQALRYDAMSRFVEPGLLGLERKGDGEDAGPFVGAVDESGSMMGLREIVAKAVALVCADIARTDGREYALIAFSSNPSNMRVITSNDNWQAHIEWAGASQWGGTDFDMVIGEAIEQLGKLEQADCADCLFISDGGAGVRESTIEAWDEFSAETGARMFYVPCGRDRWSLADIEEMADEVVPIGDLDESAGDELAAKLGVWVR